MKINRRQFIKQGSLIIPAVLGFESIVDAGLKVLSPFIPASSYSCTGTAVEYSTTDNSSQEVRKTSGYEKFGQTFLTTEQHYLCTALFEISKSGSPTGNIWAELYDTSAGAPTGAALATSDSLDVSSFSGLSERTFTFSTPYLLSNAHTYAIAVTGDFSINGTDYVNVTIDTTNPYAGGVSYRYESGSWIVYDAGRDLHFSVRK